MIIPIEESNIVQHYAHFWGKYDNIFEQTGVLNDSHDSIFVLEFSPDTDDQDWTYATAGMSRSPMFYPDNWQEKSQDNRAEIFIYSKNRNEDLKTLLAALAGYPFLKNTFLAPGHTIPGVQGIGGNPYLTDILFLRPIGEPTEFEVIHRKNFGHIQMLWIIPIYSSERKFIKRNGWNALVDLFYDKKAETSDFYRKPVVD
jgi:hypothetical protein